MGYNENYNRRFFDDEKDKYSYQYPHVALTADCVIFGFDGKDLKILLVERALEPYKGMWALPGGFMKVADKEGSDFDKSIEDTARRELKEETNITNVYLEQFKVYSRFDRDPRERVVTVAFIALVGPDKYRYVSEHTVAGDDASNAIWWNEDMLPPMAFDHEMIINEAKKYLAEMIRIKPIAFNLLDSHFSMSELQNVYEQITGERYDRRNFQRKAIQSGWLTEIDTSESHCCETETTDNACTPLPGYPTGSSSASSRRKKLFSLRSDNKRAANEDAGSIKEIFNF